MSGGVDSSVAAALLKHRGYDVIGLTMQIWQESQRDPRHAGCCSLGAVEDARRVARQLDIPHYVINLKEEFKQAVIENFIDEYARGRTPNPCVQCNRHVKFELLFEKMREMGCDRLATGHYARIRKDRASGEYRLMRARGDSKDQTYVLYMLGSNEMAKLMFPLGELPSKEHARHMARSYGLHLADKPDSQEICFVSEAGGYQEFLRRERPDIFRKGLIVDPDGKKIGEHEGVPDFTVGQRRGLGISGERPMYVLEVSASDNRVVVGDGAKLEAKDVVLEDVFWAPTAPQNDNIRVRAKVRYNMPAMPATLVRGAAPRLRFDRPVRAIAPGQIAVAYRGATLVAGGTIR
ncbi:MAG: tRNA-specific 2-thiouridylase MnmA [Fimbriimonadaceae bacterium]|nr:tRNA-specific 2-thiouridylase MnmA [Fimbriimonadaceae bacterium]